MQGPAAKSQVLFCKVYYPDRIKDKSIIQKGWKNYGQRKQFQKI